MDHFEETFKVFCEAVKTKLFPECAINFLAGGECVLSAGYDYGNERQLWSLSLFETDWAQAKLNDNVGYLNYIARELARRPQPKVTK